jgi:hypothetical protein
MFNFNIITNFNFNFNFTHHQPSSSLPHPGRTSGSAGIGSGGAFLRP